MKILVTGANGFLGQHLCNYMSGKGYEVLATGKGERRIPTVIGVDYHPADLTNAGDIKRLLESQPDVVIHTAAMSKPDECNTNRKACIAANVEATRQLATLTSGHLIYTSTDFVFGEDGPHAEDDPTGPLNFYGETKLEAEQLVQHISPMATIVRPVFIYGQVWEGMRGTFLHWVKTSLEKGVPIKVVSDQRRTPSYAPDICQGIERLIELKKTGTYHLAGPEVLSPYEMAIAVASHCRLDEKMIEKVTSDTFSEPVRRAKRSGLKIEKAIAELNYKPVSFEEGLSRTFAGD